MGEERYETIREIIGDFVGDTLIEITQQSQEEFEEDPRSYVILHFASGRSLQFFIDDEFVILEP